MAIVPRPSALLVLASLTLAASCGGASLDKGPAKAALEPPPIAWTAGPAGRLRVDDGGSGGLPVLFVHGLGGSHTVWTAQLDHLRKTRRAAAMDLRGNGESAPPANGDYSIPAMASDVAAVADALGLQRFVLVGHSWGGPIAACYAAQHPERVAGILFCDPAGDLSKIPSPQREAFLKQMDQRDLMTNVRSFWEEMLKPAKPATREAVLRELAGRPPQLFKSAWLGMFDHDTAADLARIPAPMMTVITPQNHQPYSLQTLDPAIAVREVAGVSHWIQLDDPEGFDRILDDFLAGLR